MEFGSDEADDKIIVVGIEAIAGQANVVRVILAAISAPNRGVFHENCALFFVVEAGEIPVAAQGIPYRPGPFGVEHVVARPGDERVLEVRFVARGVRAPEHGEFGPARGGTEGIAGEHGADVGHKQIGRFREKNNANTTRVVCVQIERVLDSALVESANHSVHIPNAREDLQLHVEPSITHLRLAINRRAALEEIGFFFF